jgi:hypothetical protein
MDVEEESRRQYRPVPHIQLLIFFSSTGKLTRTITSSTWGFIPRLSSHIGIHARTHLSCSAAAICMLRPARPHDTHVRVQRGLAPTAPNGPYCTLRAKTPEHRLTHTHTCTRSPRPRPRNQDARTNPSSSDHPWTRASSHTRATLPSADASLATSSSAPPVTSAVTIPSVEHPLCSGPALSPDRFPAQRLAPKTLTRAETLPHRPAAQW